MHILQLFIHFVQENSFWGYGLLYFSMIFEGELFLTAAGLLSRLEAFEFLKAFIFAFLGVLTGDVLWYSAGRYLKKKHSHNKWLDFAISRVKKLLPGIEKNPFGLIFISKFIYGLNHSTILVLGYLEIEFKRFIKVQFFTSLLWVLIFLVIGYNFGDAALRFTHRFDKFVVVIVSFFALILIGEILVGIILEKIRDRKK